jgi:hypothetical protein
MIVKNSMDQFAPYMVEPGNDVVTPLIITYGTLTLEGSNCRPYLTGFDVSKTAPQNAKHLGKFKLPNWAFYGPIFANYTGQSEDFIIVDVFAMPARELAIWEMHYGISMLEGIRIGDTEPMGYRVGILKLNNKDLGLGKGHSYAKIFPYTNRAKDEKKSFHCFSSEVETQLLSHGENKFPTLPCL